MVFTSESAKKYGMMGGRKSGTKNKSTLKREEVLKDVHQAIMGAADVLLNRQMHLAHGQTFLYKIEKYWETVTDKKGKKVKVLKRKPPKLVKSEFEIRYYLTELVKQVDLEDNDLDNKDPEATYYFMTVKEPSNQAIESMQKRLYGNAIQPVSFVEEDVGAIIDPDNKEKSDKAINELFTRKSNKKNAGKRK